MSERACERDKKERDSRVKDRGACDRGASTFVVYHCFANASVNSVDSDDEISALAPRHSRKLNHNRTQVPVWWRSEVSSFNIESREVDISTKVSGS